MAGHSKAEIVSAVKAVFANKQLPDIENGNLVLMMSEATPVVRRAVLWSGGLAAGQARMECFETTGRARRFPAAKSIHRSRGSAAGLVNSALVLH